MRLRVLYRLREAGYEAFLVGGCVRDLLLGITPKDFDIATSALPGRGQTHVSQLPADRPALPARACVLRTRDHRGGHVPRHERAGRAAGRRRRGRISTTIEIAEELDDELDDDEIDEADESTVLAEAGPHQKGFHGGRPLAARDRSRHAGAGGDDDDDADRVTDEHGRILRDNAYGNIDDDVWRRDFTANSLYYNIADFSIWDYTGGWRTSPRGVCRLIGDPVHALSRGPGAHAARGALRGQARLHARRRDRHARSPRCASC